MALPSLPEFAATLNRLASGMLWIAAGSVLLLALAGLVTLAMRRASAAARHEVWLLAFASVLLLPILAATLPSWHILPRLTATNPVRADETLVEFVPQAGFLPAPSLEMSSAQPPAVPTPDPTLTTHLEKTGINATSNSPSPTLPSEALTPPTPSHPVSLTSPSLGPNPTPSTSSVRAPWTIWALLCWPLGTLLVLCRVFVGHLSLWSLRRRCARLTCGEWFDLLQRLRRELGLRRTVELLISPHRTMPMTWGVWRARLLLPEQANDWPPAQRRHVLLHELGHVRRRDCLAQLLSQLACALYWFNPLAWLAWRRMQLERERACDDLVLNTGAEPPTYARNLLQSVTPGPALRFAGAAVAMARPSTLEERMRAILNPRLNRRALSARGSLAIILLLTSALLPAAILRAQPTPPQEPTTDSAPARTTETRGPRDATTPTAPQAPSTRPAGPQSGRNSFGGPRAGGFGGG